MSRRSNHRRRGFDDDDDRGFRNELQPAYRKPSYAVAEAPFNPAATLPASVETAPPVKARVKFYNGAKKFGILRTVDGVEYFLPGRVLPADVGEERLRPATEIVVRVAPDKGDLAVVVEVVEIKPPAIRTERGTVARWDGRSGFIELDAGGQWIYMAARVVTDAGIDADAVMGARVEVECTITHKPAAIAIRKI